jgi:hypothetical protein
LALRNEHEFDARAAHFDQRFVEDAGECLVNHSTTMGLGHGRRAIGVTVISDVGQTGDVTVFVDLVSIRPALTLIVPVMLKPLIF